MKSIILVLCLFTTINIFADLHFGVKAGVNYNKADIATSIHESNESYFYSINYSGGIFLIKDLNEYFYISIEGLLNNKGLEFTYTDGVGTQKLKISYFEVPVLVGLKYTDFYVYSGLYFAKYLSSIETCKEGCTGTNDGIYDKELESSDTGIILGFGYQLNRFLFDLRYSKGISDINVAPKGSDDYAGIDNFYQFIFSVGFMFK